MPERYDVAVVGGGPGGLAATVAAADAGRRVALVDAGAELGGQYWRHPPTADGDDALRLKVTLKDGDIIYYYLDPDTFLEIRKEVQEFVRGSIRESVTELGSYKPVAGVMYPFAISQGSKENPAQQTTTVEKIEANVDIDKGEFAVPASLKSKGEAEKK